MSFSADVRLMISLCQMMTDVLPFGLMFDVGVFSLSSTKHWDAAFADLEEGPRDSALEHHLAAWRRLCHGKGLWGEACCRCHVVVILYFGRVLLGVLIWLWEFCLCGVTTLEGHISQLQVNNDVQQIIKEVEILQLLSNCLLANALRTLHIGEGCM